MNVVVTTLWNGLHCDGCAQCVECGPGRVGLWVRLYAYVTWVAYTDATYTNVPLTGGHGSGMLATIVILNGVASSVTITNPGQDYQLGDTLGAAATSLGGTGSGFSWTIAVGTLALGLGLRRWDVR